MDTSALAKRYRPEVGSGWVINLVQPSAGNLIVVSELAVVEMTSVLARHRREGVVTHEDFNYLLQSLIWQARNEYLVIPLDRAIMMLSRDMLISHTLRTLDAIQLASALRAKSLLQEAPILIAADKNLLAAAFAEGLATDNPLEHR